MNNKTNHGPDKAAAIKYSGSVAATVVAKGEGDVARKIEAIALEQGIPLIQNASLTNLLCNVPLDDKIPESILYAVAEVIAHIYNMGDLIDFNE